MTGCTVRRYEHMLRLDCAMYYLVQARDKRMIKIVFAASAYFFLAQTRVLKVSNYDAGSPCCSVDAAGVTGQE